MATATELVTEFTFDGSLNPLKIFNADLAGGIFLIAEFGGAMRDMTKAVVDFVDAPLQGARSLEEFSRQTGIAVETVSELGFAASVLGSDVGAVQSTLESLQQKIGEAALRGSEDFARLGISVRDSNGRLKNSDQILTEVGARFRAMRLDLAQQRTFASALGIDPSLLQLLNQTSGEISRLRQQAQDLGALTSEQTELSLKYANAQTTLKFATSGLQNQIAVGFAPELTRLTEAFTELLTENKDFIKDGIKATVENLGIAVEAFGRVAPVLGGVALAFGAAKIAAVGFGTVVSKIPIVTAITAAILIVDDLVTAFRGGESVIKDVFNAVVDFFDNTLTPFIDEKIQAVRDFFDEVSQLGKKINEALGFGDDDEPRTSGRAATRRRETGEERLEQLERIRTGGGTNVSNRTITQEVNQTILTSDPVKAGETAADNVQGQLRNAEDQLDKGGM